MNRLSTGALELKLTLVIFVAVLSGCVVPDSSPTPAPTAWHVATYTYATRSGSIWRIDTKGYRVRLLAPDGVGKWELKWSDDHRWLAYVGWEFPEPEGIRIQTLFVMGQEGKNVKKLAGPARIISYSWDDPDHIRLAVAGLQDDAEGPLKEGNWFRINVETDGITKIEEEVPIPTNPPSGPHLVEAPNGQWAILTKTEGSRSVSHLLDADRKQVAFLYDQPADLDRGFAIWSKDSQWFIYRPLDYDDPRYADLYLYHPASFSSKRLTTFEEEDGKFMMGGFDWSPNGEWLLFALDGPVIPNQLCVIHFGNDPDVRCFDVRCKSNQSVWSSDSRFVAFLAGGVTTDIYVLEVSSGEVMNLTQDSEEAENWIIAD